MLRAPQRVEIEVVGGLVEYEEVRLGGEHHHDQQTTTLPARQHADRRVLSGRVEPEPFEERTIFPIGLPVRTGHQLPHDHVGIER